MANGLESGADYLWQTTSRARAFREVVRSSGRTHRLVNVTALIVPASLALAWLAGDYSVGTWQSMAALGGGYFLFYWSKPYGWMFRHRGISHEHFVGTITRVLIMGLWLLPLVPLIVFGVDWKIVVPYTAWVFLGLTVADSMHIAADGGHRQLEHRE